MPNRSNLVGKTFGILTVKEDTGKVNENNSVIWKCECECGNIVYKTTANLKKDNCKSCGCLRSNLMRVKGAALIEKYNSERLVDGIDVKALDRINANKNSKSGIKGVSWSASKKRWIAQIYYNGKNHNLGRYHDVDDAISARQTAEKKLKQMVEELRIKENNL